MATRQDTISVNEPDFSYAGVYTYADYLKWTIEERLELIKGKVFRMSPAPNTVHQILVRNYGVRFTAFFPARLARYLLLRLMYA